MDFHKLTDDLRVRRSLKALAHVSTVYGECAVAGSFALYLAGELDRPPHDLDVIFRKESAFKRFAEDTARPGFLPETLHMAQDYVGVGVITVEGKETEYTYLHYGTTIPLDGLEVSWPVCAFFHTGVHTPRLTVATVKGRLPSPFQSIRIQSPKEIWAWKGLFDRSKDRKDVRLYRRQRTEEER